MKGLFSFFAPACQQSPPPSLRALARIGLLAIFVAVSTVFAPLSFAEYGAIAPTQATAPGVLVKFRATTSSATQTKALKAAGCSHAASFSIVPGLSLADVTSGATVSRTLALLRANPNVEFAEPNYILSIAVAPNDTRFASLYGLHNTGQTGGVADADIDAPEAWDLQTGNNVVVAVIDTGADYNHADLAANIWSNTREVAGNRIDDDGNGYVDDIRGWDFANNDNNPMDDNRHGTHVSGTIAAVGNNTLGVTGVNWRARIMPLKFLTATGAGSTANAIAAVNYAVRNGAKVINASWGGGAFSQALLNAITAANNAGVLFVTAAGNNGTNNDTTPSYPANYNVANIVAVAATDSADTRAGFSNFGPRTVHVAAPGVAILSTVLNNAYASLSGTSMASPHVAGVATLMLGANPTLTVSALKSALLASVDAKGSLTGVISTGGRVNAFKAVTAAGGAAPAPPPAAATLAVSPLTAIRATGTALSLTGSGGTLPYTWASSNTAMAVTGTGSTATLTSSVPGTTSVTLRDAANATAVTGTLEFRTVTITSASVSVTVGSTLQLNAAGGRPAYTWSASAGAGSINPATGLFTAIAAGQSSVSVTDADNITGTTTITVTAAATPPPVITTLAVTPLTAIRATGTTLQLTGSGGTLPYTWATSNAAMTVVGAGTSANLTSAVPGTTTITLRDATNAAVSTGSILFRTITPTAPSLSVPVGSTLQFSASGGRAPYTWATVTNGTGSINTATGLFTGLIAGQTTVSATDADNVTGSVTVTVTAAVTPAPTTLAITPSSGLLAPGTGLTLTGSGGTLPYTWLSSNTAVASIAVLTSNTARLTTLTGGVTSVTVTDANNNQATTGTIEVRVVALSSSASSVNVGGTVQVTANGGRAPYTWSVSNSALATITSSGALTALAAGSVTASAIDADGFQGISGAITLLAPVVTPAPTVTITPNTATVLVGATQQFTASGGATPYTWSTDSTAASIAANGLLTGVSAGSTVVTAVDANGVRGSSATIVINAPVVVTPPAGITVSPNTATVNAGATQQFTASGGTPPYGWNSNSVAAMIDQNGLLTGLSAGIAIVTAQDANGVIGFSGTITINAAVAAPPPTTLTVTPATATVLVGATQQFSAAGGTAPYTWSTNSTAASISAAGLLTGLAAGSTTVTAVDANGITGISGTITVNAAAAAPGGGMGGGMGGGGMGGGM